MGNQITIKDIHKGTEVIRRSDGKVGVISGFRVWSGDDFDFTDGEDGPDWRLDAARSDSEIEVMVDERWAVEPMGSARLPNFHRRFRVF